MRFTYEHFHPVSGAIHDSQRYNKLRNPSPASGMGK